MGSEWARKEEWHRRRGNFQVVVSRHEVAPSPDWWPHDGRGPHRWAVYAYFYPRHPHFAAFSGDSMWQGAATCLPVHSYPSLLRKHESEGKVTAWQVGADYNHDHDAHYTHLATKDEAASVFMDAEELFRWCEDHDAPAEARAALAGSEAVAQGVGNG